MKFSIIVPVYNVEQYIEKCLDSICNQTYSNYEVIIVNDGSKDQSEMIIKKYIHDARFQYYKKENGGLSDARNYGLTYVTGEYLLFVDSDDYIEPNLLQKLNEMIAKKTYDVIRFGARPVDETGNILAIPKKIEVKGNNKFHVLKAIMGSTYIEPAWLYAYQTKFFKDNQFQYSKGKIHEDYGLTPLILDRALEIGWLDEIGYNYVQRENSIMRQLDYKKLVKRVGDFQDFYIHHKNTILPNNRSSKLILGFCAEALIYKAKELKDQDREKLIMLIRKEHVIDQIYPWNFKKFLQKLYLTIFYEKKIKRLSDEFFKNEGSK